MRSLDYDFSDRLVKTYRVITNMMKFITYFAIALLFCHEAAIAQRKNISYDAQYPKGHTERRFVAMLYDPVDWRRHETCRQLAGVRYAADVETVKSGKGWACYEILR